MKPAARMASALGALALAGCNMVVSDEPWLTRGPDSPVMKPGVWVDARDKSCRIDTTAPLAKWPDCAQPAIIRADGTFLTFSRESKKWRALDVVMGSGDPTVVQVHLPAELAANMADTPAYIYLAMRPTERDAAGEVTAMETWLMMCGPLDEAGAATLREEDMVTKAPFAGLTVKGANCTADNAATLTRAAAESEAMAMAKGEEKGAARWVMDAPEVATE